MSSELRWPPLKLSRGRTRKRTVSEASQARSASSPNTVRRSKEYRGSLPRRSRGSLTGPGSPNDSDTETIGALQTSADRKRLLKISLGPAFDVSSLLQGSRSSNPSYDRDSGDVGDLTEGELTSIDADDSHVFVSQTEQKTGGEDQQDLDRKSDEYQTGLGRKSAWEMVSSISLSRPTTPQASTPPTSFRTPKRPMTPSRRTTTSRSRTPPPREVPFWQLRRKTSNASSNNTSTALSSSPPSQASSFSPPRLSTSPMSTKPWKWWASPSSPTSPKSQHIPPVPPLPPLPTVSPDLEPAPSAFVLDSSIPLPEDPFAAHSSSWLRLNTDRRQLGSDLLSRAQTSDTLGFDYSPESLRLRPKRPASAMETRKVTPASPTLSDSNVFGSSSRGVGSDSSTAGATSGSGDVEAMQQLRGRINSKNWAVMENAVSSARLLRSPSKPRPHHPGRSKTE